jgi:hypothetical protein
MQQCWELAVSRYRYMQQRMCCCRLVVMTSSDVLYEVVFSGVHAPQREKRVHNTAPVL